LHRLSEIEKIELNSFFESLTESELKYYKIKDDKVLDSLEYIQYYRNGNNIYGIGGIAKWYKVIPHTFYMLKENYQGRGIGKILALMNIEYAKKHLTYLTTIVDKENIKAVKIADKTGFKLVGQDNSKYYYIKSFKKIGKIVEYVAPTGFKIMKVGKG
jgi:RimJ/RimL family protein N-acetyltransferase